MIHSMASARSSAGDRRETSTEIANRDFYAFGIQNTLFLMATPIKEAAHIAQTRSIPAEEFMWSRVDRAINRPDPGNNGRHLLVL
jgi:hypothetical protein